MLPQNYPREQTAELLCLIVVFVIISIQYRFNIDSISIKYILYIVELKQRVFMKKLLSLLAAIGLALLVLASCSKDDDPKDNDLFIGKYKGRVSYISGDETISNDDGSVTVVKVGDKYTFNFSDGIPSIKDKEIKKGQNSFTLDWDEGSIITIDESNLSINMIKEGAVWSANLKR